MNQFYRAMWEDDTEDVLGVADRVFRNWVESDTGESLPTGDLTTSLDTGSEVRLVRAKSDAGEVLRASYHREAEQAWWTTQLTAFRAANHAGGWFWVDVEKAATDPYGRLDLHAPRVVRDLLADGSNPRLGQVRLSQQPLVADSPASLVELVGSPRYRVGVGGVRVRDA